MKCALWSAACVGNFLPNPFCPTSNLLRQNFHIQVLKPPSHRHRHRIVFRDYCSARARKVTRRTAGPTPAAHGRVRTCSCRLMAVPATVLASSRSSRAPTSLFFAQPPLHARLAPALPSRCRGAKWTLAASALTSAALRSNCPVPYADSLPRDAPSSEQPCPPDRTHRRSVLLH